MSLSDIVREGTEPARKIAQGGDYFSTVQNIAAKIQQQALASYEDFDPNEQDFDEVRNGTNRDMEKWIEAAISKSRWPDQSPVEALKASYSNADAFQHESLDFSGRTWRDVLYEMAFYAMKADVYAALQSLGWDERTGFPHEVT